MSMIFQFRMLCDEDDYFLREYEVPYDITLSAFRDFMDADLRYRPDNITSFFTADDRWNKLHEFTSMDMGLEAEEGEAAPTTMETTLLSQLIHNNKDKLIYQFDLFGERALYLELIQAKKAEPGVKYPQVTVSEGEAPDQDNPSLGDESRSIFDDAMGDFNEFSGSDQYNEDE